jgi:hypothetical protein
MIEECRVSGQLDGVGMQLFDVGVIVNKCRVEENAHGGIFIANSERPNHLVPEAV